MREKPSSSAPKLAQGRWFRYFYKYFAFRFLSAAIGLMLIVATVAFSYLATQRPQTTVAKSPSQNPQPSSVPEPIGICLSNPTSQDSPKTDIRKSDAYTLASTNFYSASTSIGRISNRATKQCLYNRAVTYALRSDSAYLNNEICWFGALDGFAYEVISSCEQAVKLSAPGSPISNRNTYVASTDSRGLARALLSNNDADKIALAKKDFQYFVDNFDDSYYSPTRRNKLINTRLKFISQLGKTPIGEIFSQTTLDILRYE
jgi:hypothetical protein